MTPHSNALQLSAPLPISDIAGSSSTWTETQRTEEGDPPVLHPTASVRAADRLTGPETTRAPGAPGSAKHSRTAQNPEALAPCTLLERIGGHPQLTQSSRPCSSPPLLPCPALGPRSSSAVSGPLRAATGPLLLRM
ncbi:hypothetical protein COCON_G00223200 [Conger conger]|uniref:Uncharacterized protein n=1 Tax=Conger conger TaxID=82655 RepID=A0A9Q1HN85_CONCO|nr:hypothetical protein COCON_G00223200 [Conger conger]